MRLDEWQGMIVSGLDAYTGGHPVSMDCALDVYLQNSIGARRNALLSGYPTIAKILGPRYFSMLVTNYIVRHPSRDCNLNLYGHDFSQWLRTEMQRRQELSDMPYLADLASLEAAWSRAMWLPFPPGAACASSDPEKNQRLIKNPTLSVITSCYDLDELWRHHQTGMESNEVVMLIHPQHLVVNRRPGEPPRIECVSGDALATDLMMIDDLISQANCHEQDASIMEKIAACITEGYILSHGE